MNGPGDLLDRVDWPHLVRYLVADQPAQWVGTALKAALGPHGVDTHDLLAQIVFVPGAHDPEALVAAVAECSDLDVVDADTVATWLARSAEFHRALAARSIGPAPDAAEALVGEIHVDQVLADLALVPLARDLARARPDLLTALVDGDADGACGVYDSGAGRITLDLRLIEHRSPDDDAFVVNLTRVLAHELGHALDPALRRRPVAEREQFADAVADHLVAVVPRTMSAAAPLVAEVVERFPCDPAPLPRLHLAADVLRFRGLPLELVTTTTTTR